MVFHGSMWFFIVLGWFFMVSGRFSWFFMVLGWFFMVPGHFSWFFIVPGWLFMVPGWFSMIFHGSRSVFMVFHGFRSVFSVFLVPGWFFMVPGRFSVFFLVPGWFFMVSGRFSMIFHGSRLVFMVFSWFQVSFQSSRLVFHGSRLVFLWFFVVPGWFFMVFRGSRLVFHGFSQKCTRPSCILARRSSLGIGPSVWKKAWLSFMALSSSQRSWCRDQSLFWVLPIFARKPLFKHIQKVHVCPTLSPCKNYLMYRECEVAIVYTDQSCFPLRWICVFPRRSVRGLLTIEILLHGDNTDTAVIKGSINTWEMNLMSTKNLCWVILGPTWNSLLLQIQTRRLQTFLSNMDLENYVKVFDIS